MVLSIISNVRAFRAYKNPDQWGGLPGIRKGWGVSKYVRETAPPLTVGSVILKISRLNMLYNLSQAETQAIAIVKRATDELIEDVNRTLNIIRQYRLEDNELTLLLISVCSLKTKIIDNNSILNTFIKNIEEENLKYKRF